jgi:hypothetical protein
MGRKGKRFTLSQRIAHGAESDIFPFVKLGDRWDEKLISWLVTVDVKPGLYLYCDSDLKRVPGMDAFVGGTGINFDDVAILEALSNGWRNEQAKHEKHRDPEDGVFEDPVCH